MRYSSLLFTLPFFSFLNSQVHAHESDVQVPVSALVVCEGGHGESVHRFFPKQSDGSLISIVGRIQGDEAQIREVQRKFQEALLKHEEDVQAENTAYALQFAEISRANAETRAQYEKVLNAWMEPQRNYVEVMDALQDGREFVRGPWFFCSGITASVLTFVYLTNTLDFAVVPLALLLGVATVAANSYLDSLVPNLRPVRPLEPSYLPRPEKKVFPRPEETNFDDAKFKNFSPYGFKGSSPENLCSAEGIDGLEYRLMAQTSEGTLYRIFLGGDASLVSKTDL